MRDYQDKNNRDGQPDSITATKFGAGEFDSLATENKTAVERAGLTLAPANGAGEDTTQLAQSLFIHSTKAASFQDSGAANAYVLTPVSGANGVLLPSDYAALDGASVSFTPGNANTGAVTINVGQTAGTLLGSKAALLPDGSAFSGGELGTVNRVSFTFSAAADGGSGAWLLDQVPLTTTFSVFSADGTWTAPSGCRRIRVFVVGGGGAGAGAEVTGGSTSSFGGGGAGGAMAVSEYTPAQFGSSQTVTVGDGGTGVSAGAGNAGGTSSFGALVTAEGGGGGNILPAGSVVTFGNTSLADVNTTGANLFSIGGAAGSPSFRLGSVTGVPGNGGPSPLGGGIAPYTSSNSDGRDGRAPGAAGSGASSLAGGAARTGGNGADGIVIIEEYY